MDEERIVDAHIHVWSPDFERYPLMPGFSKADLWQPSFTPDDHFGYSRQVGEMRINLVQMTWYGLDHRYIIDLIESAPDTFVGTGIVSAVSDVSLPRPDRAMRDLAKCGIYAFRVRGGGAQPQWGQSDRWLEQEGYERMFAAGAEDNLALSFLMGPREIPELIRPVIEAFGAERCMWESDSGGPLGMEDPQQDFPATIDVIAEADFLSAEQKQLILSGTATRFFFERSTH